MFDCREAETGKIFAMKIVDKTRLHEGSVASVREEVAFGLDPRLQHDSVMGIREAFEDDEHFYMVMEKACGGPLSFEEASRIYGVIHKALKGVLSVSSFLRHYSNGGVQSSRCLSHACYKRQEVQLFVRRGPLGVCGQ